MYNIYGNARITGNYGDKRSYYKPGKFHEGDDIALTLDSPINAVSGGTVAKIGFDKNGYGNYIDIDHGNGYTSRYAHANGFDVKVGDKVNEGQAIGRVGQTGRASGPHIHFEMMKDGKKVNPRNLEKYFISDSTIKPKGIKIMANEGTMTGAAADLENLKQQIAQQQDQDNRLKLSPEEAQLRQQTISNILNRLSQNIEVPQKLSIQDILNGQNFSDRLKIAAQYMEQPEFQRNFGNAFGTRTFNPHTRRFESTGHRLEREARERFNQDQSQAIEQQKIQDLLNTRSYDSLNDLEAANLRNDLQREIALQNLLSNQERLDYQKQRDAEQREYERQRDEEKRNWQKEQFDRQEELKRKELEAKYGIKINPDGTITGGAATVSNTPKMSTADDKKYTENKETISNIEAGLESLKKYPGAYGPIKGLLPSTVLNITDKKGIETRAIIDNITAVYRKWLTGAQMSDKERKAYERFLPAPTDTREATEAKLQAMKNSIERSNQAILSKYNISDSAAQTNNDPLGLGL